jgi:prepilin signal peptidase PulO-like enzyme (type II secretory pathway)
MPGFDAVTSVAIALALWTMCAFALVRRAQVRAFGTAATPWLALACTPCIGALALALRPLPEAAACGTACIALALAADADARTGYLFDAITLPTAILVLAIAIASGSGVTAAIGCSMLCIVFGVVVVASRGRAMGMGDVKAMASIGAAFGPAEAMLAIAAACTSGIIEASVRGRLRRHAEIRFGPHLAVGATFALVAGGPLTRSFIGG